MKLKFYNTLGRQIQDFIPLVPPEVGLYTCGPTVYNFAHIGNLRTYIFEDLLRRTLEYAGYSVRHIMNVTDVGHLTDDADEGEDKMVKSSREEGRSVWDIAKFYTEAFFKDTDRLNILRPHTACAATDHIQEMIDLIRRIEENGFTYSSGGNLYFSIDACNDYGKLALLDREGLRAGARIDVDGMKRNPHDFVLWFTNSKFTHQAMMWDSPWGRGYPGWHVECSAMSMKYLGEQFDIHCGGVDHIPVHHTNEIAQSEAATGKKPWVRYWLHGEFLLMNTEKMAKSAHNFITLDSLTDEGFSPLDYRYFCLGAHYRRELVFSREALEGARIARNNLVERVQRLREAAEPVDEKDLSEKGSAYLQAFREHLAEDLGVTRSLADLWSLLKDPELPEGDKLTLLLDMDKIFGLKLAETGKETGEVSEDILDLIKRREEARKNRDFTEADRLRDQLDQLGIVLEDTPAGTRWKRKV
ncbi:MAG: cysteine--tRNA ligase [Spirochaetales bacterium]|nr:cysteine--tRNA ligase [Spirochaetales bacterium]